MACTACHYAKRKCDKKSPCTRCVTKGLECIPHISRQGRKKQKREEKKDEGLDCLLLEQVTTVQENRNHFGLKYLVRSWVSFAFRRRSFGLMQRACSLAMKCGFSMDEILCEQASSSPMNFLPGIILIPRSLQKVTTSTRLQWTEIPERLLRTTDTLDFSGNRENRWIWVREMNCGESRYLVSKSFENDVVPWKELQDTWDSNRGAVIDLFVIPEDKVKHTKSFAHQISLYKTSTLPSVGNRLTRARIRLRTKNQGIQLIDQVSCLEIVNLDVAYLFVEYIRAVPPTDTTGASGKTPETSTSNSIFDYFDLDGIAFDNELEQIFTLVR